MKNQTNSLAEALAGLSWRHEVPSRAKKYAKITEGITNPHHRRVVEVVCEQQLQHIHKCMDEATLVGDVALFKKYSIGVIPRIYPQLFIKDLIAIQPIPLPNAKVFYKDFYRDPTGTKLNEQGSFDRTYANRGNTPHTQPNATPPASALPSAAGIGTNELTAPKKIKMTITAADIVAQSKALQYEFSAELNQDLQAYHGTSADPELSAEAANEIQREIEYDIINMLLAEASAGNVNWNATPPAGDASKSIDIEAYNRTLFHAIVDARQAVFKKRYSYPTWMVCHPDMSARLEKLQGFEYDSSFNKENITQGRQFFGTLRGVIRIYVDPWWPQANKALLGFKGATDFDVGAVFCPYIPFYGTKLFENPQTLGSSRALLSRNAQAMLVPDMYSTITITNAS